MEHWDRRARDRDLQRASRRRDACRMINFLVMFSDRDKPCVRYSHSLFMPRLFPKVSGLWESASTLENKTANSFSSCERNSRMGRAVRGHVKVMLSWDDLIRDDDGKTPSTGSGSSMQGNDQTSRLYYGKVLYCCLLQQRFGFPIPPLFPPPNVVSGGHHASRFDNPRPSKSAD